MKTSSCNNVALDNNLPLHTVLQTLMAADICPNNSLGEIKEGI